MDFPSNDLMDVKAAFLNAKLERKVYVYPPNGMQIPKDKC
jgi:hypothetical protein